MAPVMPTVDALAMSQTDKDRLDNYVNTLGLEQGPTTPHPESVFMGDVFSRIRPKSRRSTAPSPLSPQDIYQASHQLVRRDESDFDHGKGTVNPYSVNNKGVLVVFALLSAALVITAIWFFFWAKNGGFVFREGDWEDYKSSVLRRKGRNGKTLSNATKSTDLGGDSVRGEYDREDVPIKTRTKRRDNDMREYRHEKPARVGGLNRPADGSYYDTTNTDRSEVSYEKTYQKPAPTPKKEKIKEKSKGFFHRSEKKVEKKKANKRQTSTAYSFAPGDDSTVADSEERYQHRHSNPPRSQPQRSSRGPPTMKPYRDHDVYSEQATSYGDYFSEDGDIGTKAYQHHIPGVSKGTRTEASFERGERKGKAGYRRGGGRRDSLSDSDGETRRS
ncbi:MAG: hypothetical protein M1817_004508 [Caeruleum heppii]|nr:MAG: hypothetical protein M1817_004508 [Caeruleum heppii]